MEKRHRDMHALMEAAGLEITRVVSKNARLYAYGIAPNGAERQFSLSTGRSDARGDLNEGARMKRFARENTPAPEPQTAMAAALWTAKAAAPPAPPEPEPIAAAPRVFLRPKRPLSLPDTPPTPETPMSKTAPAPAPAAAPAPIAPKTFYLLCEWLKTNPERHKGAVTFGAIASVATAFLMVEIAIEDVKEAYAVTGIPLPEALRPVPLPPHVVLARELEAMVRKLGETPSEALLALTGKPQLETA